MQLRAFSLFSVSLLSKPLFPNTVVEKTPESDVRMAILPAALLLALVGYATAQYYPINGLTTGVNPTTKARPLRVNILDLENDIPKFSLYIQALAAMQTMDESNVLSYFQIAGRSSIDCTGIHGRPYLPWDGVDTVPGAPSTGYCTHGKFLNPLTTQLPNSSDSVFEHLDFPSALDPNLTLFQQQVLASHAQEIAKTYPSTMYPTYQAAADQLRIPYWDWASDAEIPSVVSAQTVKITTPSGVQTVKNPLYQYNFQHVPLDPNTFPTGDYDGELATYNFTVRFPDYVGSGDDIDAANTYLTSAGLTEQVWTALMKSETFNNFVTMASAGSSIESPHGTVHVYVGGAYGHMSMLSYSAFDPIFWLHHANVDRITALYQAMYPGKYISAMADAYGTYTIPPNTIDTQLSPLKPFAISSTTFHTSTSARSLSAFGYSYPEITDWNQTASQLTSYVTGRVNALYSIGGANSKRMVRRNGRLHSSLGVEGGHQGKDNTKLREWSASISVSKFDLQGQRFIVRLFCGSIPEKPEDWATSSSLLGSVVILPPPVAYDGADKMAHDEIVLLREDSNHAHGGYAVPDEEGDGEGTVEYLKENLRWRVQFPILHQLNHTLPSSTLRTLQIVVAEQLVTIPNDPSQRPVYGPKTLHPEIVVRGY
ncbi:hypothetical protein CJF31_00008268 [Rutstroemia sp. NJR-2017a BVV2]|nr:hypothetical protein CJF31_00008268 [Rutstroemia sp. NJR-2017a BVV2]